MRNIGLFFCSFIYLSSAGASGATSYQVIDLTPSGSAQGWGISGGTEVGGAGGNAVLWTGTAASVVNLNPVGYINSLALATAGSIEVGYGNFPSSGTSHALMWTGTAASAVDLNPVGATSSAASGTGGGQEVGSEQPSDHAILWTGTAGSAIDLNPAAASASDARATDGVTQVGWALVPVQGSNDEQFHAVLWHGTAESATDLNPSGFTHTELTGLNGTQEVGLGFYGSSTNSHAMVWYGSADSYVDLNPEGFVASEAYATNGEIQVGQGYTTLSPSAITHALAWSGSADSAVDLQQFLPSQFTQSFAKGINADGVIIGYARGATTGGAHAIMWVPIPEPENLLFVVFSLTLMSRSIPRRDSSTRPRLAKAP